MITAAVTAVAVYFYPGASRHLLLGLESNFWKYPAAEGWVVDRLEVAADAYVEVVVDVDAIPLEIVHQFKFEDLADGEEEVDPQ